MPYIKDSFSILAECAAIDLPDTQRVVRESEVREGYNDIEEAAGNYSISAEMVPVVQIGEEYYTEAQLLAPFMRDAKIRSMAEALDAVAEANKLPAKSIGLLIESECAVTGIIEKACAKGNKAKDAVMDKISKATDLVKDLKSKGFPVKRKINEDSANMKTAKDYKIKKIDDELDKLKERKRVSGRIDRLRDADDSGKYDDAHKPVYKHLGQKHQDEKNSPQDKYNNMAQAADAKMRHDRRHGVKEEVENLFDFD